jgi:hypothetical protein
MQSKTDALADRVLALAMAVCPPGGPLPPLPRPQPGPESEGGSGVSDADYPAAARLRDEVIVPRVRAGIFGKVTTIPIERVIPSAKYGPRHELLSLMDLGFCACCRHYRQTAYYADQKRRHGAWLAVFKVARYYRLFRSVRKHGLKFNLVTRENLPVAFCGGDVCFRLDGAHRASVARFIGCGRLPVVMVTPQDVLALPDLPEDVRRFAASLPPPPASLS